MRHLRRHRLAARVAVVLFAVSSSLVVAAPAFARGGGGSFGFGGGRGFGGGGGGFGGRGFRRGFRGHFSIFFPTLRGGLVPPAFLVPWPIAPAAHPPPGPAPAPPAPRPPLA